MKKIINFLVVFTVFVSCKSEADRTTKENRSKPERSLVSSTDVLESAIIYEANIRQYSKEGTFEKFTQDIPQLKELGVKVIWLMPIFPISETKRKATGGKFVSEFPEDEQEKYLGSYYAVSDFKKINPEFGTINDFRALLKTAHDNDIAVILDWVPNHTGWDHTWIRTNPEFYTKNENGEIIHPEGTDWTDVADLNYDNKELRKTMVNDMLYWVEQEGVDGFRCDVAGSVPTDFWEEAIPQLRAKKDLFLLAEAWEPELLKGNLFDMAYGWDRHHAMNHIAKGEHKVSHWNETYTKDTARYESDDILMTFVTNHDENSWNGTIKERMGEGDDLFTTLSYVTPGMPLIYSGQEYGLDHRLKFFEKDSIPKTKGKNWNLLQKLAWLKQNNKALHGGKNSATYKTIPVENENILAFSRSKENDNVLFIGNLSKENQSFTLDLEGEFKDYFSEETMRFKKNESVSLAPWKYHVLIKK